MKATQSANVDTLLIVIFIYAVGNSANTQREVKTAISAKKKQKHHYWYLRVVLETSVGAGALSIHCSPSYQAGNIYTRRRRHNRDERAVHERFAYHKIS